MNATESRLTLKAVDGYPLEVHFWDGTAPARFVVQIAHGMGEHARRYRSLAEAIVAAGGAVCASEHRGHGADAASRDELGDFGPGGFAAVVDDLAFVSRFAQARHPGAPLILLGHSMGSFAAQAYMLAHSGLVAGVALSGTTALDLLNAARSADWKLEDANLTVANPRTPFDWLSRDPAEVDKYIADPLCGFTVNGPSFVSIFETCAPMADVAALKRIRSDLPVFVFSGSEDPINNHVEWFDAVVQRFRAAGMTAVSTHVYGGARHEVFNETNRAEVVANLLAWIAQIDAVAVRR